MSDRSDALEEDAKCRVRRLLNANPNLSQRELTEGVGISAEGAHYFLGALVEKGLVKIGNFSANNDKRRYAYIPTPQGRAEKATLMGRCLARKLVE